jgi:hypothetical protein
MYLITLAAVILLPIVPAYLLFKALPSTAAVSGPLKGLELKLGGGFAGYFALVLLVLYTAPTWNPPRAYELWSVDGQVVNGVSGKPIEPLDSKDVTITAPQTFECANTRLDRNGLFKLYFAPISGPSGLEYPKVLVGHNAFATVTIDLTPAKSDPHLKIDSRTRHIDAPIKLEPEQPFSPQGSLPPPLPPGQEPQ